MMTSDRYRIGKLRLTTKLDRIGIAGMSRADYLASLVSPHLAVDCRN